MIYANVELTVEDRKTVADKNIVLYRGDRNVEIRFVIKGNRFTVLDSTYAQMIIRRPSATSVFSDPTPIQNDTVVFTISEDMIDELKEIGAYTFQVRLYDNSMNARATLPPCEGCLIINQPIATEGEALVNAAMINDSAVLAAAYSDVPEDEIFDDNNAYNRTVWMDGDIITDVRMNKIEDALYYINEKGGGGTATAPYISTSLPETVMVGSGEDFELDLDFSSPNLGKGTLKVFINDVDSMNLKIDQGMSITTIPGSLFSKGTNMVVIYVLDRVGMMSNSLTFYIRYGGTEVTSTFDAYVSYDYGATVRYYFTPTALDTSLQLTFYMEIDGTTQAGVPCISDVRSYYTFPTNLEVGNHYCRAWVTDGTTRSNVLTFNLIILDATSLVVATDTLNPTVEEGTQLVLDYKVYMKNNTSFITKTYVDNNLINTGTCTLETAYYRTTSLTAGTHTIKVEVFDVTETYSDFVTWTVTVTESTYTMLEPSKAGSTFMATAYNKSNVDENREVWIGSNQDNEDITASLSNFSFNSENGWIDDALVISGNSWVEIPIQPLANNAQYGFTLDIEFKTKAIGVEDAEVLTLWNETDNCGIKITTEQLILRSKAGNQCDLYFAEDEIVSAIFVIDRDEKTAKIYLNGVMCEAFALSDYEAAGQKFLEDFTVNSNVYLGGYNKNGYCAIKNIRIYEVALATNEILNNFMSNEKDKAAQRELVEFQKGNNLPTLTIYCDFAGLGKDDKKPCNIVYNSPDVNLYGESFTLDGKHSMLQYQGTSSMQYPIKNYRINPRNADGKVKLDPFNNGVGESRFTLKADFMSSGHWQNTGLAKWVNDKLYNYNVNDESTMNARKWYDLQNGGSLKGTRESINGFPCRLILVNDGETALNEGQQEPTPGNTKDMGIFNFNNDKDNVATLGFDTDIFPNCMSFEVTANSDTSAGAFVPCEKDILDYTSADGMDSCSVLIPVNIIGGTRIRLSYTNKIMAYDENKNYLWTTVNGNTVLDIPATGYFRIAWFSSDISFGVYDGELKSYTRGNKVSSNVVGARVEETKELEYLQNSFELRYPDADDVGEDYGYLGIKKEGKYVDYWNSGGYIFTTKISTSLMNGNIQVEYPLGGQFEVVFYNKDGAWVNTISHNDNGTNVEIPNGTIYFSVRNQNNGSIKQDYIIINGVKYLYGLDLSNEESQIKDPYISEFISSDYGLKRVIDWVGNATDEQFVTEFDQYFHRDYTLRYYLLVITLGMVDNLGKNMMFDTFDGKIWLPRFYDMDTICSYDNSGEIKFDVDIEMEQGYWNTSSSRLWTKIRDLMHDELVEKYNNMRQNGMSYESFMSYFYDKQIAQIPQTYYNKDYDVKYAPYADEYMGKAHGDGYEHLKRWLKRRLIFTDTLFDYAPSYTNDALTIRANTLDLMSLEIETYTPVYQHVSFYNGNMEKIKIDGKTSTVFEGNAQTATDQEVLIYGGSNIKAIRGIQSMNPNSMLIGNATRLTELDLSNCPILTVVNSNKANFSPHTYLNKLDISNCPQLGGTLNISNSPLLQEVNALGSAVDNILFPTSVRNLETLRVPKTVNSLTLTDAGLLYTLEMEEGNNLQSISMTNCNNLTEMINFDLTRTPTVFLDNSFNGEEIYMTDTTNLTLRNMPSLKRVIFTPNSEYSAFDINNVINGKNYKLTTFNNPMMTDFITTAPHRNSYNDDVEYIVGGVENDVETEYLVENYNPHLSGFEHTIESFDFEQHIIRAKVDLSTVTSVAGAVNILSIGQNITTWNTSTACHIYFITNQNNVRVETNGKTIITLSNITKASKLDIEMNKSGLYVNGVLCISDTEVLNMNSLSIGSVEGNSNTRSDATYTYIAIDTIVGIKEKMIKDYGDITPNTAFTANTLDLADTQFQNVKFLCTTDIYNLKVPTSMKNFYCDSAMDIDTDVIEHASYEVIHEELIEPYTTNYEGEVYRHVYVVSNLRKYPSLIIGSQLDGSWNIGSHGSWSRTDYIQTNNEIKIISGVAKDYTNLKVQFYDKDKNKITGQKDIYGTICRFIPPDNAAYAIVSFRHDVNNTESLEICITEKYTPNIIPSSASGSLIFNMYSNNTTQPTSTSPYMWDLTGLKLEDFYTYGMNNWVKPSEDSYEIVGDSSKLFFGNCTGGSILGNWTVRTDTTNYMVGGFCITEFTEGDFISDSGVAYTYRYTDDLTANIKTGGFAYPSGSNYDLGVSGEGVPRYFEMHFSDDIGEWLSIGGVKFYIKDMRQISDITQTNHDIINIFDYGAEFVCPTDTKLKFTSAKSITMPQRMSGYSVRLVNADITPDEYPTMLYPKLIDTSLPITGKLDYTKYNGTSLAWAYAYTTGDVTIDPLDSRSIGQITNDYNKLYGTDFVDVVDVWAYASDDYSSRSTNEEITKAYIELTSSNYDARIDEVLQYYPNCTDVYLFEDGSVTSLNYLYSGGGHNNAHGTRKQVKHVTFMDGYFNNIKYFNVIFYCCENLETVNNIPKCITEMKETFYGCIKLNQHFDFSDYNIIDDGLKTTFSTCKSLTTPPILPSNYTGSMANCFQNCSSLTQAPTIPQGVTNMANTFSGCSSLTTAPAIPSGVTNMQETFKGCTSLTQAPIIPSGVDNMAGTFRDCTSLTTAPTIPDSVTNMRFTFYGCTSLTTAPTIPSNVTSMENTFYSCTSLTTAPAIPDSVTNMAATFYGCTSLTQASNIGSGVTDMASAFSNCTSLTTVPNIPSSVTTMNSAFSGCTSLTNLDVSNWDTSNVTNMEGMFAGSTVNPSILSQLDLSSVTKIASIFNQSHYKGDVTISNINAPNLTNMNGLFHLATGMTTVTLHNWNTPSLVTFSNPVSFYLAHSLTKLDVSGINGSTITSLNIFLECSNLTDFYPPTNISCNFDITGVNKLSQDSVKRVVSNLAIVEGKTLTLGTTYLGYLTEDEITQATDKGWTLQ